MVFRWDDAAFYRTTIKTDVAAGAMGREGPSDRVRKREVNTPLTGLWSGEKYERWSQTEQGSAV